MISQLLLPLIASCAGLDSDIARAMAGKRGTALVADAATGRLLGSFRQDLARQLHSPPGSTIKPFTLAAWIDSHAGASPGPWPCPRELRLAGRRLDCVHPLLAQPPDPAAALAYSCNCYFAHLALTLQPADFARALRGLANTVSIARTPEQLELQAIGEWGVEATPFEWLAAWRHLAGQRKKPALASVFEGLEGAVAYGSAQLAAVPEMQIAGKTGTGLGHAWFAGFAPSADPRFVVVVLLEQGRGGSDAAPIAREIFRACARGHR